MAGMHNLVGQNLFPPTKNLPPIKVQFIKRVEDGVQWKWGDSGNDDDDGDDNDNDIGGDFNGGNSQWRQRRQKHM